MSSLELWVAALAKETGQVEATSDALVEFHDNLIEMCLVF